MEASICREEGLVTEGRRQVIWRLSGWEKRLKGKAVAVAARPRAKAFVVGFMVLFERWL